jgi:hypothetical protein
MLVFGTSCQIPGTNGVALAEVESSSITSWLAAQRFALRYVLLRRGEGALIISFALCPTFQAFVAASDLPHCAVTSSEGSLQMA